MSESRVKGINYAIVAAVISGVAVYVNKFAVAAITPPLVFTASKNAIVGLLIIGIILMSGKWKKVGGLSRSEKVKLGLIGIVGGAIPFYLFFTGLAEIPAVSAQLINKSMVLWVALLAIPLLGEKLSMWQVGAIGVLYSSNLVVGGFDGFGFNRGELMVLMATMLWSIEHVIAKKTLPTVDADLVVGARMGMGSAMLLFAAGVSNPGALMQVFSLSGVQWVWMALTAGTLLGYVMCWYRAIKYAPVTLVASVLVGATLITNALTVIFETGNWSGLVGSQAVMVLAGIGIMIWQYRESYRKQSGVVVAD